MKAKYNHWLPKLLSKIIPTMTINAIVLFGTIYFNDKRNKVDKRLYKHELAHVEQQQKDGIKFYIKYLFEYFINLVKYKNHFEAYYNISYEIKARKAEEK